jgi:Carboxypeptidase regulatory-like domain/TonB dependent receptor
MKSRACLAIAKLSLLLVVTVSLGPQSATGQSSAGGGSIQGTVRDATAAVIPGARVEITHLETSRVVNTVTNEAGFYSTPPINIGKYRVIVRFDGMKTWVGDLIVETGRAAVVDAEMSPGDVKETVTITGHVNPMITTNEGTVGNTLDRARIEELPLNGRDLNRLIENVTPGLESTTGGTGGLRSGGLQVQATDYVQDGAATVNRELGGPGRLPGLESVGEVRVETSTSSARLNRPTTVILTTRSGTNQVHGSLFETHRNNGFGVARARQDVLPGGQTFKAPKLIRNEFGGSISGPIFLPLFGEGGKTFYDGRNRSFFFFTHERLYLRQGITRNFRVPTLAMRQGDFSGLFDPQGRLFRIYDPLTTRLATVGGRTVAVRDQFPNNQIPLSRISPLAQRIYALTPLPTDITNPLVADNLTLAVPTNVFPNLSDTFNTLRLDHRFTEKDNTFFKLDGGRIKQTFIGNGSAGPPTTGNEANVTSFPSESLSGAFGWTHTFTPTFFLETLVNSTHQKFRVFIPVDQNWSEELGLPNPRGEIGWPNITAVGVSASYIEGDNRRGNYSTITNIDQNYTNIRGTHELQFGGRFHHEYLRLLPDQGGISGSVGFNSLATALQSPTLGSATNPVPTDFTGNDAANFFLGYGANYFVGLKRQWLRIPSRTYSLYFQDNYRVTPRLTLNLGVRWDISPVIKEKQNLFNTFDVASHSMVTPEPLSNYVSLGATTPQIISIYQNVGVKFKTAQEVGLPKTILKPNYFDISPRLGFAYRLFNGGREFVARGGYGYYIFPPPLRNLFQPFGNTPPFVANYNFNLNAAAQSPDGIPNYLLRTVPTVIAGLNSTNVIDLNSPTAIGRGLGVAGLAEDQSNPRVHEWSFTLEKEIATNTVVRMSYKGNHANKLEQYYNINPQAPDYVWFLTTGQPLPTGTFANVARRVYDQEAYTDVTLIGRTGYSNTQEFDFEVQRRFSDGLGFQAFYALTNAWRNGGNGFRDSVMTRPEVFLPGTVPTDFDELNRLLNYRRENLIPKHRIRGNLQYDLPFGKGKRWLSDSNSFVNTMLGGWKLGGQGTLISTWFALPTDNWGQQSALQIYRNQYKILDCRATPLAATNASQERCTAGYLWFNGYISERFINSHNAAGLRNGVFGLPDNYRPAIQPVNPWPRGGSLSDPNAGLYDTNNVDIRLSNGTTVRTGVNTGLHPFRQQFLPGPYNWLADVSLFKFFQINERVTLRFNVDVFNVFNRQGLNPPAGDGIASLGQSYTDGINFRPRQLQGTLRLEW